MNQIDDCEPIQHQEAEDNFGLCNQGCSANLPSKMMTFTIAPKPTPKPTPVSKPKKPSFGAAFGRTETIGGTKQCGHREFDDLNLPKSEVSIILNDNGLSPCRLSSDQPKQCFTVLPEPNKSIKVLFPEPKPNRTEHIKSV